MRLRAAAMGLVLALLAPGYAPIQSVAAQSTAAPSAAARPPLKLKIPYNAIAYDAWPLWVAMDEHLFEHYGVEATPGGAMESPTIAAAILSGEIRFAIFGEDAVIAADLGGADLVILTADTEKLLFAIYAPPAIKSVADLKDKKLAISQSGTTTDFLSRYVLKHTGLRVGEDVALLPVGSLANRVAALQSGTADAAIIGPPITFTAQSLGFHPIAVMTDYDFFYYTSALVAQRSWVEAHRAETLNVVRGYMAGGAAIVHDKPAALAVLSKYTKITDPNMLAKTYDAFLMVLLRDPVPKPAALRTGLDESKLPNAKTAKPESFIDTSFVTELEKDGFIAGIYKN